MDSRPIYLNYRICISCCY